MVEVEIILDLKLVNLLKKLAQTKLRIAKWLILDLTFSSERFYSCQK